MPSLDEINLDIGLIKSALRAAGVPAGLLESVATRALRSQRRTTGQFQSNRNSRWTLQVADPQYGTEADCKVIYLRLLGMMCEFKNAPVVAQPAAAIIAKYLGKVPEAETYRDALTLERLDYLDMVDQFNSPIHGKSDFHLGHDDPTVVPKHRPNNVSWRSHRSNLIQGDMTLGEARTKLVELIGRYFQLGEVTIQPDG